MKEPGKDGIVRAIVAGLIKKDNNYLLVKEQLKTRQAWIIPGGGVEFGESLEESLTREMKEELGVDISKPKFIGFHEAIFPKFDYHTIIFFYEITDYSGEFVFEDVILDTTWVTKKEALALDLVDSAKVVFERFIDADK